MELAQIIRERRSVQKFKNEEVKVELVKELLDTAVWVPNHKMTQPWRFIIVSGDSRQKLIDAAIEGTKQAEIALERKEKILQKINGNLNNVPLFIIVVMKKAENTITYEEDYAATSCVIQNFSLLAWEKGIGNIWKTNAFLNFKGFHEFLGVQPEEQIIGNLHVGYPEKIPNVKPRKEIDEIITILD